jgi:hypothetical protein
MNRSVSIAPEYNKKNEFFYDNIEERKEKEKQNAVKKEKSVLIKTTENNGEQKAIFNPLMLKENIYDALPLHFALNMGNIIFAYYLYLSCVDSLFCHNIHLLCCLALSARSYSINLNGEENLCVDSSEHPVCSKKHLAENKKKFLLGNFEGNNMFPVKFISCVVESSINQRGNQFKLRDSCKTDGESVDDIKQEINYDIMTSNDQKDIFHNLLSYFNNQESSYSLKPPLLFRILTHVCPSGICFISRLCLSSSFFSVFRMLIEALDEEWRLELKKVIVRRKNMEKFMKKRSAQRITYLISKMNKYTQKARKNQKKTNSEDKKKKFKYTLMSTDQPNNLAVLFFAAAKDVEEEEDDEVEEEEEAGQDSKDIDSLEWMRVSSSPSLSSPHVDDTRKSIDLKHYLNKSRSQSCPAEILSPPSLRESFTALGRSESPDMSVRTVSIQSTIASCVSHSINSPKHLKKRRRRKRCKFSSSYCSESSLSSSSLSSSLSSFSYSDDQNSPIFMKEPPSAIGTFMLKFPSWYAQCLITSVRSLNLVCVEYLLSMLPDSPLHLPSVQSFVSSVYPSSGEGKISALADVLKERHVSINDSLFTDGSQRSLLHLALTLPLSFIPSCSQPHSQSSTPHHPLTEKSGKTPTSSPSCGIPHSKFGIDFTSNGSLISPCANVVHLLLLHGADPCVVDGYGLSPFDYLDRWVSLV